MGIIDAHLHFVEEDLYFNQISVRAGHINSLKHLRSEYDRLGIVGGVVMGNRGLEPERHQYPRWLRYCIGLDRSYLSSHDIQGSLKLLEYHLKQEQCAGIKLYPGYNPVYVSDQIYDPVYELAVTGNRICTAALLFIGFNIFASGMFTALSNGIVSAVLAFSRSFVFMLITILVLPMILGVNGIWLATPAAELMALALSAALFGKYRKRYQY